MPPTATATATDYTPLTADERTAFEKLLARASASSTPATRPGDSYLALANINVPHRGSDPGRGADIVYAGETVNLTPEEAAGYLRCGPHDGRKVPVIQKLSGPDGTHETPPRLPPRALSGRLFRPSLPPPDSELPRPDPEGSSSIQVLDDGRAPETSGSMQPEPSEMDDHLRSAPLPDAVDIPPSRSRSQQGRRQ
jgi:hypothetical protein